MPVPIPFESWLGSLPGLQRFSNPEDANQSWYGLTNEDTGRAGQRVGLTDEFMDSARAAYRDLLTPDATGALRYGTDIAGLGAFTFGQTGDQKLAPVTLNGKQYTRTSWGWDELFSVDLHKPILAKYGLGPDSIIKSEEYGYLMESPAYWAIAKPLQLATDHDNWFEKYLDGGGGVMLLAGGIMAAASAAAAAVAAESAFMTGTYGAAGFESWAAANGLNALESLAAPLAAAAPAGANIGSSIYEFVNVADPIEAMWQVEQWGGPSTFGADNMLDALHSLGLPANWFTPSLPSIELPSNVAPDVPLQQHTTPMVPSVPGVPVSALIPGLDLSAIAAALAKAAMAPLVALGVGLLGEATRDNNAKNTIPLGLLPYAPGAVPPGGALAALSSPLGIFLALALAGTGAAIIYKKRHK